MCEVLKLKAEVQQFLLIGFSRFLGWWQNRFQDLPVFQQSIIDVSYITAVASFGLLLVVVIVAAIIIAKFFIYSSFQGLAAIQAVLRFVG
jgi:hypothetical protein